MWVVFNTAMSDIQACCVSPEADIDPCYLDDDVPDAVTAFYRVNDVAKFRLDRPFYSGDKSDGDVKVWTFILTPIPIDIPIDILIVISVLIPILILTLTLTPILTYYLQFSVFLKV